MWTKFDVISARTIDTKDGQKKFVMYSIKIHKAGSENDNQAVIVERRYTDFLELYTSLCQAFPRLAAMVSFPRKVLLGDH